MTEKEYYNFHIEQMSAERMRQLRETAMQNTQMDARQRVAYEQAVRDQKELVGKKPAMKQADAKVVATRPLRERLG